MGFPGPLGCRSNTIVLHKETMKGAKECRNLDLMPVS